MCTLHDGQLYRLARRLKVRNVDLLSHEATIEVDALAMPAHRNIAKGCLPVAGRLKVTGVT